MALICEIRFPDRGAETTFVIFPSGLYLLPHRQFADACFGLVWCRDCDGFRPGEVFESQESIEARKMAIEAGDYSPLDRLLIASGIDGYVRWRRNQRAAMALRRWRSSPPRCGRCGGMNIDTIDDRHPIHPATGETLRLEQCMGSTSIDLRLTILSIEGEVLGEISSYDATGRPIGSDCPYEHLAPILADAGIAIDGTA